MQRISITECPRDAMQGIARFIPTEVKVAYIQLLLKVGFDRLDFGSFVSPQAIPQMKDTAEVLKQLDTSASTTELLTVVANVRGAEKAATYGEVGIVGYPFSVSETFQLRNANSTIARALDTVKEIVAICHVNGKVPLIYLSMGFGNPYGDPWSPTIVVEHIDRLVTMGVRDFALADTVGTATPESIAHVYRYVAGTFPGVALGLHLHSIPGESRDKLTAALDAGCTRFDTALRGFGGCPMAEDQLTGNIATETLLQLLYERGVATQLDGDAWAEALRYSNEVF